MSMKNNKESIMNNNSDIVLILGTIILIVMIVIFLPSSTKDHEVISPEEGISCVVVSRMFNTSVDCWKDK